MHAVCIRQVNRPATIKLQYFWLAENMTLKQLDAEGKEEEAKEAAPGATTSAEPAPAEEPADQLRKWAVQVAEARTLTDGTGAAHSDASRKVKMLTSMLNQLLNVARLAKIKVCAVETAEGGCLCVWAMGFSV